MKIKLLGLTIFEIQKDPRERNAPRHHPANAISAKPSARAKPPSGPPRPWAALDEPADTLPRTKKGRIDVGTSLRLCGITDLTAFWRQKFGRGTAGAALKCILGSMGRKPVPPACDSILPDLETYPAKDLPLLPGTGKLNLEACLALFGIRDPAVLWKRRFKPYSAGGRIKMCLRACGFDPNSPEADWRATGPRAEEPPPPSQVEAAPAQPSGEQTNPAAAPRAPQGTIDIQAALAALGITEPKSLWQNPVEPGSAQHELKKAIARTLARREPVPGITRLDIGLTP
jgi:hypothetical protein